MTHRWRHRARGALLAFPALMPAVALAQPAAPPSSDLPSALERAYATNPDIQEARAQLRALDEGVPIARAAGLPSLAAAAKYSATLTNGLNDITSPTRDFSATLSASVPLYMGGAVRQSMNAARQRVVAGRHDLGAVEENVFANVVDAYMSVIRDEAVVTLNQRNVSALEVNLKATTARFDHGELTKTDVAQSVERLDLARAVLQSAEVTLATSRERYVQVVGEAPGALPAPPPLRGLPPDADTAIEAAMADNPDLASAHEKARAYGYDAKAAAAGRLPHVSAFGSYEYDNYFNTYGGPYNAYYQQHDKVGAVGVQVSVPLFQGGLPLAQQRQALAQESAAMEHALSVERQVIETARSAYITWRAADGIIAANQAAVDAAGQSLVGVRAENKIGNRTILDILNAEQELLSAQVQLVSARRDAYVAGFNLLAAMGRATARDLGFDPARLYDPQAHYRRAMASIWDWGSAPPPTPAATSTAPVPLQDGVAQ